MKYKKRGELLKENYELHYEVELLKSVLVGLNNLLCKRGRTIKKQNRAIIYVMGVCLAMGILTVLIIFRSTA